MLEAPPTPPVTDLASGIDAQVDQLLAAGEYWVRGASGEPPRYVAGWEDGLGYCAAVSTTDIGLAFCRTCHDEVVDQVLATSRPAHGPCRAGVICLGFPAPRGSRDGVGVLRVSAPPWRRAAVVAEHVRVAPGALRRAARESAHPNGSVILRAARVLRDPAGLHQWQADVRARGADRGRTATAVLAQMVATSDEFLELWRESQRQQRELRVRQRRLDRLAREAIQARDRERAQLAHAIHDTAAQSMVSAYRFVEAAAASTGRPAQAAENLRSASERLAAAIAEIRGVLNRLIPYGLGELGLHSALEGRIADLTAGTGAVGGVRGELPRLPDWVEGTLYGMASEAISNAVRHGHARRIDIALGVRGRRAIMEIVDDGVGFDTAEETSGRHQLGGLGLEGLARQAGWLGGRATISSQPGRGTRVRISVPLIERGPESGEDDHGAQDRRRAQDDTGPAR